MSALLTPLLLCLAAVVQSGVLRRGLSRDRPCDSSRPNVIQRMESFETRTWHLAMNLNPADGHVMDFTTGWAEDKFIGTYQDALIKDYLNSNVWRRNVSYIALVRHQDGESDAVKVFRFKEGDRSMLSRFQDMNPGRYIVTEGGPIQRSSSKSAYMGDDPIFSIGGDLAFNWGYANNGVRITLTGGNLSQPNANDDDTHGLGNHFACDPTTGLSDPGYEEVWGHEISNAQYSPYDNPTRVQGTDHGTGYKYVSGPVYGNYAIYVSEDANNFPNPGEKLDLEIDVVPFYKYI